MKKVRLAQDVTLITAAIAAVTAGVAATAPTAAAAAQHPPADGHASSKSVKVSTGQMHGPSATAAHACVANIPVRTNSGSAYMLFWWKHSGASTCIGTVERYVPAYISGTQVRLRIWHGHTLLYQASYPISGVFGNHVVRQTFPYGAVGVCTALHNPITHAFTSAICNNAG
jgi:hypothetical protein